MRHKKQSLLERTFTQNLLFEQNIATVHKEKCIQMDGCLQSHQGMAIPHLATRGQNAMISVHGKRPQYGSHLFTNTSGLFTTRIINCNLCLHGFSLVFSHFSKNRWIDYSSQPSCKSAVLSDGLESRSGHVLALFSASLERSNRLRATCKTFKTIYSNITRLDYTGHSLFERRK